MVVDVGVSLDETSGMIVGDVDQTELKVLNRRVSITPTPGKKGGEKLCFIC